MADTSSVRVGQHELAVISANEALSTTPVVFIHGVLVSAAFWTPLVPAFVAAHHPWYSIGLPAHYPSRAPADFADSEESAEQLFAELYSEALLQLVGEQPVILVGHSTGGFAAVNLAAAHPARVRGIVSVAGFAVGDWGGLEGLLITFAEWGLPGKMLFEAVLRLSRLTSGTYRWGSRSLAVRRRFYASNPLTRRALDAAFQDFRSTDLDSLFTLFQKIGRIDIRDRLPSIRTPALILYGDKDPVIARHYSEEMLRMMPSATGRLFEETGHMIYLERPEEYVEVLQNWIAAL